MNSKVFVAILYSDLLKSKIVDTEFYFFEIIITTFNTRCYGKSSVVLEKDPTGYAFTYVFESFSQAANQIA